MNKVILPLILVCVMVLTGCWSQPVFEGKPLIIDFLDVGHGDCSVIKLPTNEYMLIDCGEADQCSKIEDFLDKNKITKLDYVIFTHPHSDHIGSGAKIIEKYEIGKIYMPKATNETKVYEKLLKAIKKKNLKVNTAKAGVSVLENSELSLKFVAPNSNEYDELNNYSAVLKITYKNNSFLFTGDAQTESEEEMYANYDISADVLKVGHHGSNTSTSEEFLKYVNPKIAVISTDGISYNHPHKKIVSRLENFGCEIYRTDTDGNIILSSDGTTITKEERF